MNTQPMFEILGFGQVPPFPQREFQLRLDDGTELAPRRETYDEVQCDLLMHGGTRPIITDRSGGFLADGWRISWATLDRLTRD